MKYSLLCFLLFASLVAVAQKVNWDRVRSAKSDKVLLSPGEKTVKTLLLGTFHFEYHNLDAHKTDSSRMIDILSPQRQKEVGQVVEILKQFKPTRIYVESMSQQRIDSLYSAYLAGRHTLRRNEIDQLGLRLAKTLGHQRLYAVDASNLAVENGWIDSLWNKSIPVDPAGDRKWDAAYKKLYDAGDSLQTEMTILESLLVMADRDNLRRMHGHYLCSGFGTADNNGPDALSLWWYNRNLRIFNKILQTKPGSDDRILVIFGNGHMPILKQCFESSPAFEVVDLELITRTHMSEAGIK